MSKVSGVPVPPWPGTGLVHRRMSWQEYLDLPESAKAEWVDGVAVLSPPVGPAHGRSAVRLGSVLDASLPHLFVLGEVGLRLPGDRLRAPDVMVVVDWPEESVVTEAPLLVVEVLSASTRSEDTVRKSGEYAAGGVGQYWLLDPELRRLDVYENTGHGGATAGWSPVLHLDDDVPLGEVRVGEHGTVALDVRRLLPPPARAAG